MSLIKIVHVNNKPVVEQLKRIADYLQQLIPPIESGGELKVVEISGIEEPKTQQEILDEEDAPKHSY